MRTLVLNAGFEPMLLVGWQRALCLVLSDKAEVVASHDTRAVRTISSCYPLPSVVRLHRYINVMQRFNGIKCNRKNTLIRDRHQCQYCGSKLSPQSATIDHVIPLSRGGKTNWTNVVTACGPCNRSKGDRLLSEISMQLRTRPRGPTWNEWLRRLHEEADACWLPYIGHS